MIEYTHTNAYRLTSMAANAEAATVFRLCWLPRMRNGKQIDFTVGKVCMGRGCQTEFAEEIVNDDGS